MRTPFDHSCACGDVYDANFHIECRECNAILEETYAADEVNLYKNKDSDDVFQMFLRNMETGEDKEQVKCPECGSEWLIVEPNDVCTYCLHKAGNTI